MILLSTKNPNIPSSLFKRGEAQPPSPYWVFQKLTSLFFFYFYFFPSIARKIDDLLLSGIQRPPLACTLLQDSPAINPSDSRTKMPNEVARTSHARLKPRVRSTCRCTKESPLPPCLAFSRLATLDPLDPTNFHSHSVVHGLHERPQSLTVIYW